MKKNSLWKKNSDAAWLCNSVSFAYADDSAINDSKNSSWLPALAPCLDALCHKTFADQTWNFHGRFPRRICWKRRQKDMDEVSLKPFSSLPARTMQKASALKKTKSNDEKASGFCGWLKRKKPKMAWKKTESGLLYKHPQWAKAKNQSATGHG